MEAVAVLNTVKGKVPVPPSATIKQGAPLMLLTMMTSVAIAFQDWSVGLILYDAKYMINHMTNTWYCFVQVNHLGSITHWTISAPVPLQGVKRKFQQEGSSSLPKRTRVMDP